VSETKAPNGSPAQRVVGRPRTALPQELLNKTVAHRSTSVNSTTVVVNSTTRLQENA
jgi:hypothetical protein